LDALIAQKLDSIDWNFADSARKTGLHAIHPYPAKFIREIPRTFIELFHPGDQSPVFDPFCGSGTTLVEAVLAGLPAIGLDLHPLATLIAQVKTTAINTGELERQATRVLAVAQQAVADGAIAVPEIPRLDHWFQPNVQECLAALRHAIKSVRNAKIADALRVCFSSIIVRVSNQESDTRYAAIDKAVGEEDVWRAFMASAAGTAAALDELNVRIRGSLPTVKTITKDILKATPEDVGAGVGLVVTSPPYPNAYEYWLYHKYRMYWLDMDPIAVRQQEIGARPHFFKKNPHTAADFERQMGGCFCLLSKIMKPRANACFVMGRSIIKGQEIDNEAILVKAAVPHGFRHIASVGRSIAASRKSFNPSHGTINKERVIVFSLDHS